MPLSKYLTLDLRVIGEDITTLEFHHFLIGSLFTLLLEFSLFLPPLSAIPYLPFAIHFSVLSLIGMMAFTVDNSISIPTICLGALITIFVFFRILALLLGDSVITQMAISSLFYPQNGTILTPLALDFLQQQSHRAMANSEGKLPTASSTHGFNKGLNEDMIGGGFSKPTPSSQSSSSSLPQKDVHYGLATLSETPPKIPVLLVIAHPDDESMFFTPLLSAMMNHNMMVYQAYPHLDPFSPSNITLRNNHSTSSSSSSHPDGIFSTQDEIQSPQIQFERVTPALYDVHVLCLTTGNAAGLGKIREKELIDTCTQVHHIAPENIQIIDDEIRLPDSMTASWSQSVIEEYISEYVIKKGLMNIDFTLAKTTTRREKEGLALHHLNFHDLILLSFDDYGVSSHLNHIACFNAVRSYVHKYNVELVVTQGNLQHQADIRADLHLEMDNDPRFASSDSDNNDSDDDGDDDDEMNEKMDLLQRKNKGSNRYGTNNKKKSQRNRESIKKGIAYRPTQPITRRYMSMYGVETIPIWSKYLGPYSAILTLTQQFQSTHSQTVNFQNPFNSFMGGMTGGMSPEATLMRTQNALQTKIQIPNTSSYLSWQAMASHWSQWVWFRKLFVLFSTYSYVTPLVLIQPSPIHPAVKHMGRSLRSGVVMD